MTRALRHGKIGEMNAKELERALEPFWQTADGRTAAERARAYGIDLSLLAENLRLSPEERMDRNQAALEFATSLQKARA